ncbi:MAG: xylose isomerase [Oscillospiraceae bacterium]|nr:xylose isomerase [Oscillospiraceae bacterium]
MSYFPNIPAIKFEGGASKNPLAFRYYNADEKILGKTMKEHLRFAMSWWHTMTGEGKDMFGSGTIDKSFGKTGFEKSKARVDAGFELMQKLGVTYYCFHDYDLIDERDTLAESNAALVEITDYMLKKQNEMGLKCLWGTSNLFSNKRYMFGAGTAPNADVFAYAAAQVKQNIDVSVKLGANGIVFWGGREGYETLLNTDMGLELDNLARFLHMAVDYARSIGFKGDFFIEPKPKEPSKHQYDFDAATAIGFLNKYGLDKDFKMNIEANHATLAGHTFEHELRVSAINDMLGSIDANQGDMLLGWDTDQFPTDVYSTTYCMLEVLRAGGFKTGGLNFDAKGRRGSFTHDDLFLSYIAGMDAFALGLIKAAKIIEDGRVDGFVKERYSSWSSGIGKDITDGKLGLKELSDYALKKGEVTTNISGKQEYLENIVNQVLFN